MLLASDGITIGEKWTTVLPSKIDVDFYSADIQNCQQSRFKKWSSKFGLAALILRSFCGRDVPLLCS